MIMNTPIAYSKSIYGDLGMEVVDCIKILGVQVDNRLSFRKHLIKLAENTNKHVFAIRLLKGVGLKYDRAVQIAVCVRNMLTFGLWWTCFLANDSTKILANLFNKLLRSALSACKLVPLSVVYDIAGYSTLGTFLDYLMCLRMASRPTHSTTEFLPRFKDIKSYISDLRDQSNSDYSCVRPLRDSTMEKRKERLMMEKRATSDKRNGVIFTHCVELTNRWKLWNGEMGMEKQVLRNYFSVEKLCKIKFENNENLYDYLKSSYKNL